MTPSPSPSIVIEPAIRLDQCEEWFEKIASGNYSTLELPPELAGQGALGLEASLIHLVIAWARACKDPSLCLPVSRNEALVFLSRLCTTGYGFTALACAKTVTANDGLPIAPQDVKRLVIGRLKEFDDINSQRIFAQEEGISFLSVYGGQHEYGRWMFTAESAASTPKVQSPQQLGNLLSQCIEQIIPEKYSERFDGERLENLGLVAFELLENAYQHGRLNEYADPIGIGVRGVSIRITDLTIEEATAVAGRNKDINLYLVKRMLRNQQRENLFFEMTVFDSGIGYHRWINAQCNATDVTPQYRGKSEKETILDCLLRHATSKANAGAGVGLIRVIRLLKLMSGFIRIRTGHSCYYARLDLTLDGNPRQFGGDYEEASNPDIKLEEWFPEKPLSESSGTSVTFCVPLTSWMKASKNG
jgi:hypothetical protein